MRVVVAMSPRPRSMDKSVPISVALPQSLVTRIDQHLSYTASRSKLIQNAVKQYLNAEQNDALRLSDATLESLIVRALHICPKHTAEKQMLLTIYDIIRDKESL